MAMMPAPGAALIHPVPALAGVEKKCALFVCAETKNMAFPLKLHYIIENEQHVEWRNEGSMFEILSMEDFVAKVMPRHFRTASMSSFVRNLNYYGFRKIKSGPSVGRHHHPDFQRNRIDQIQGMKRILKKPKRPSANSGAASGGAVFPIVLLAPAVSVCPHQEAAMILQNLGMFSSPRTTNNLKLATQVILTIPTPAALVVPTPAVVPSVESKPNSERLPVYRGGTPPSQAASPPLDTSNCSVATATPAISRTRPRTPEEVSSPPPSSHTPASSNTTGGVVVDGMRYVPYKVDDRNGGTGKGCTGKEGPEKDTKGEAFKENTGLKLPPILVDELNKLGDCDCNKLDAFTAANAAAVSALSEAEHSFFLSLLCRKVGVIDDSVEKNKLKDRVSQAISRSIPAVV
jgi:hypothetical protein